MASALIQGRCDPRFEAVHRVFRESFGQGEAGAAVAITLDGEPVVDLWGGFADAARERPWREDTLVNVYSTTKGMTALCIHRLVDAGRIELDAPIALYWPEFAQRGKGEITLRQVLSHRSGVIAFTDDIPPDALFDWDALCASLASSEPAWEPGTRHGYHAKTFGHLVGELVRRVDGRSLGGYFRDEVAVPLGIDFHIGLPDSEHERCAELLPAQPPAAGSSSPESSALLPEQLERVRGFFARALGLGFPIEANSPRWRRSELPGSNGHGTAAGLARAYGALARGGSLDGVQLLAPVALERAIREHSCGPDWVLHGTLTRFSLGFFLSPPATPYGPSPRAFGHPGMGGSLAFADPDAKVGFAYVMNQLQSTLSTGSHGFRLIDALYRCLD